MQNATDCAPPPPPAKEPPHSATSHSQPRLEPLEVMRPVPNVTKRETEAQREQPLGQGHTVGLFRAETGSRVSVHYSLSVFNCLISTGFPGHAQPQPGPLRGKGGCEHSTLLAGRSTEVGSPVPGPANLWS